MIFGYRILNEDKRQESVIKNQIQRLLLHMLKCKYQNDYQNKSSWRGSIREALKEIRSEFIIGKDNEYKGALYKNFYLKKFDLEREYTEAVEDAVDETGLSFKDFPVDCEWTKEQLVDRQFIREFIREWGQDYHA